MKKRLIDANALLLNVIAVSNFKGQVTWSAVSTIDILTAPTVDAVEVVRCKDCDWYDGILCTNLYGLTFCNPDSFCCYGERKNDETEFD